MILAKEKLYDWLGALKKHSLYAPTESNGVILFSPTQDPHDVVLDHNSLCSPKGILLPQTETMFSFTLSKDMKISQHGEENGKKVIFGIRPCDAKSISVLEHVFNGEYKDGYYLKNRENTTLIGLACNIPGLNCFCTSFDTGPGSKDDVDILLTDLGDRFYVDVVTEKGKALIDESKELFTPDDEGDVVKMRKSHDDAKSLIKRSVEMQGIPEKLEKMYESDLWESISQKCLGCGICTYLCPTCHCFDIQDETHGFKGRRARMWDSCMFPEYTVHTSGHNPRPARMNRMRNRILHKLKYYPNNHGTFLCVGCGRCVNQCPVNIDIIDIIDRIRGEQLD